MTKAQSGGTWNDLAVKIDPAPYFHDLRRQTPVYFDPGYQAYVVTRYQDFMHVVREPLVFSNAKALYGSYKYEEIVEGILERDGHGKMAKILPLSDPPEHTRVRAITNALFNSRRVQKIQPFIDQLTNELVDAFIGDGSADIISQFSMPLAVTTIGEVLCLPRDRWRDILKWQVAFATCVGNYIASPEEAERYGADIAEMQNFLVGILDDRRKSPGDDVLTELLNNNPTDYEPLTQSEILGLATAFIGGGHETTTLTITSLVRVLAERPDIFNALRNAEEQDKAIRLFVEEVLRARSPVVGIPRIVTEDTEVAGVAIPAGSKVIIAHVSANHDESVFGEDSEEFDMARKNAARHVSFGGGVHVCIGAMLARAEINTAAKVIVNRLENLRLAKMEFPPSDYKRSIFDWNYTLERLDVKFDARA